MSILCCIFISSIIQLAIENQRHLVTTFISNFNLKAKFEVITVFYSILQYFGGYMDATLLFENLYNLQVKSTKSSQHLFCSFDIFQMRLIVSKYVKKCASLMHLKAFGICKKLESDSIYYMNLFLKRCFVSRSRTFFGT